MKTQKKKKMKIIYSLNGEKIIKISFYYSKKKIVFENKENIKNKNTLKQNFCVFYF